MSHSTFRAEGARSEIGRSGNQRRAELDGGHIIKLGEPIPLDTTIYLDDYPRRVDAPRAQVREVDEAVMPPLGRKASSVGDGARDAAWLLAVGVVVFIFVGLPLGLAGGLLLDSFLAGAVVAVAILVLCGVAITATMKATTRSSMSTGGSRRLMADGLSDAA